MKQEQDFLLNKNNPNAVKYASPIYSEMQLHVEKINIQINHSLATKWLGECSFRTFANIEEY